MGQKYWTQLIGTANVHIFLQMPASWRSAWVLSPTTMCSNMRAYQVLCDSALDHHLLPVGACLPLEDGLVDVTDARKYGPISNSLETSSPSCLTWFTPVWLTTKAKWLSLWCISTFGSNAHSSAHSSSHRTSHRSKPQGPHRTNNQLLVFTRILSMGAMCFMLFVRVLRLYPSRHIKPIQNGVLTGGLTSNSLYSHGFSAWVAWLACYLYGF